jgi:hypothetical protein
MRLQVSKLELRNIHKIYTINLGMALNDVIS